MRLLIVLLAIAGAGWRVYTAPMVYAGGEGKGACEATSAALQRACVPDNETVALHSALIALGAFGLYHAVGSKQARKDA